jgi:hypothetical protein
VAGTTWLVALLRKRGREFLAARYLLQPDGVTAQPLGQTRTFEPQSETRTCVATCCLLP